MRIKKSSLERRGFSLTEMGIVVGMTGLILASVWEAASYTYLNIKLNHTIRQLMTIVSNVRALYSTGGNMKQPNFTYITASMINADVFPSDIAIVGGAPINLFGGGIAIESQGNCTAPTVANPYPYTLGGCDATTFEVEFFPPPGGGNPCAAIMERVLTPETSVGLVAVYDNVSGWRDPVNVSPTNISSACTYTSFVYKLRP